MLDSNRKGFAVMNKELTAFSFTDESLENCKRYCRKGDVIVEQIPYKIGFSLRVTWHRYWKPIYFNYGDRNILWLHWHISPVFSHKCGKIVFKSKDNQ